MDEILTPNDQPTGEIALADRTLSRRRLLGRSATIGAGAAASLLAIDANRLARGQSPGPADQPTPGDLAILRFLAAAELIEDDLWQQYCELAVNNSQYRQALRTIDPSLIRYICDDRDDERSHAALINGYLISIGEAPVNLDAFRVLPSVRVPGAMQVGRLTSLTRLTVDTSWYNRYRGRGNPDFGDNFGQLVDIVRRPTVPTSTRMGPTEIQAVAHAAAFHFCAIEQGGGSLYTNLIQKVESKTVLRILASIGPTEVYHFSAFHKSLEGLYGLNAGGGLIFPDLRRMPNIAQAIFPEPCAFLDPSLPLCSVIRPSSTENAGAVAAATGLVNSNLFAGQRKEFFDAVTRLALAADAANS